MEITAIVIAIIAVVVIVIMHFFWQQWYGNSNTGLKIPSKDTNRRPGSRIIAPLADFANGPAKVRSETAKPHPH